MTDFPRFEGLFPGMAQWWQDRLDTPPLVIIRCGRGDPRCRNAIGEVKTDAGRTLAMSKNEHPEPVVPWTPLAALTPEELQAEIAERESQVLRHVHTGAEHLIVYKRRPALPRAVAPIEFLSYYSCRQHGEIQVDTAELAAFTAATQTPKRTYWVTTR